MGCQGSVLKMGQCTGLTSPLSEDARRARDAEATAAALGLNQTMPDWERQARLHGWVPPEPEWMKEARRRGWTPGPNAIQPGYPVSPLGQAATR